MKIAPFFRRLARHLWREWIRPLALPLLAIAAAKSALADINYVPSGSMQPTILAGDVVFVNKLAYDLRVPFTAARLARWSDPARGDIVVCFSPQDATRLVKRVAALPGDTIELRRDVLYLNGVRQTYTPLAASAPGVVDLDPAERAAARFGREQLGPRAHVIMITPARPALRDFGPVTVPAGHYFLLGDHRDNSHDSRFFGFVARREIVGEATGVFVSADLHRWLPLLLTVGVRRGGRGFRALAPAGGFAQTATGNPAALTPMKTLLRLLPLLAFALVSLRAADDKLIAAVRAADDERIAATTAADPVRLGAILSDQLHYAHSSGVLDTKTSYINSLVTKQTVYVSFDYRERKFTPAGPGVVLMTGRAIVKAGAAGQPNDIDLNYLAVWREENGKWRFFAWQSCRNPAPAAAAAPAKK